MPVPVRHGFVSRSYRPGASAAADVGTQANSRDYRLVEVTADVTHSEGFLLGPARATTSIHLRGRSPWRRADRRQPVACRASNRDRTKAKMKVEGMLGCRRAHFSPGPMAARMDCSRRLSVLRFLAPVHWRWAVRPLPWPATFPVRQARCRNTKSRRCRPWRSHQRARR